MTDDKLNELIERASREAAHQAINKLDIDGRTHKKALVSINDATTLCAVLAAMAGLFLWAVQTMTAPTDVLAQRNKEDIKQIDGRFNKIEDTLIKILEKVGK